MREKKMKTFTEYAHRYGNDSAVSLAGCILLFCHPYSLPSAHILYDCGIISVGVTQNFIPAGFVLLEVLAGICP